MARPIGALSVFLTANTTPFQKSMFNARRSLKTLSGAAKIASAAIAGGIAALSVSGFRAAVAAEEIESKFGVVFGAIPDMAGEAAKQISKDFDLADSTVQKMLSSTGDLLTGFGFTQGSALRLSRTVAKLAGDLASFQNIEGGAADAAFRLTKGILGETENLKSLGIVVRQDTKEFKDMVAQLVKAEGLTQQQAKAQVILTGAIKQSKNAIGDYARTQDSTANSIKRLSEAWKEFREGFGEVVKQLVTFTAGTGKDFAATLKDIGKELKNIADQVKLLSKAGGFRNLLNIAGTGRSLAESGADELRAMVEDELGGIDVAEATEKQRERAIKAVLAESEFTAGAIKLFRTGLPAAAKEVKEFADGVKKARKARAEALRKGKAAIDEDEFDPTGDIEQSILDKLPDFKKVSGGPNLSAAIRAETQAAFALRTAGVGATGTEEKMRKKNVKANIETANEIKKQNRIGVKIQNLKVVGSLA